VSQYLDSVSKEIGDKVTIYYNPVNISKFLVIGEKKGIFRKSRNELILLILSIGLIVIGTVTLVGINYY
ncbi:MAG TPA: hypothetical protein PKK61_02810, partial [Defluviitaleaceae bacterium]|nr:hypothetical protein [Defluviitaleaceae bacterium]